MTSTSPPATKGVTDAELIERLRGPVFGTPTALDAATAIETWKTRAERLADMHRDMCVVAGEAVARAEKAEAALASLSLPPPGEGEATVPSHEWLPMYGKVPFKDLGRDVNDAIYAMREDYAFGEGERGHQMLPAMNFNSLNRIVSKYAERLSPAAPELAVKVKGETP